MTQTQPAPCTVAPDFPGTWSVPLGSGGVEPRDAFPPPSRAPFLTSTPSRLVNSSRFTGRSRCCTCLCWQARVFPSLVQSLCTPRGASITLGWGLGGHVLMFLACRRGKYSQQPCSEHHICPTFHWLARLRAAEVKRQINGIQGRDQDTR